MFRVFLILVKWFHHPLPKKKPWRVLRTRVRYFRVWRACNFGHVRCVCCLAVYFVKEIWWFVFAVSVVYILTYFSFFAYRAVKIEESTDIKPVVKEVSVRESSPSDITRRVVSERGFLSQHSLIWQPEIGRILMC